jgi:hypothetical protein
MHARVLCGFLLAGCSSSSSPSVAEAGAPDAAPIVDATPPEASAADAGARAGYGEPCELADAGCADGLFCLEGPSGGSVGFCTKTCPSTSSAACPGAPAGTAAYCVVTDVDPQGDKGCAFLCRVGSQTYTCPGALKCQTTEDPPGSGQYLCLP